MNKIYIVIPYFGKFPNSFNIFLRSASYQVDYEFHFFTNIEIQQQYCFSNIFFHQDSLEDIQRRASNLLGFDVTIKKPYKLCDYKPLYNKLFDVPHHYSFWGFCDIDVVLGNLSNIITKEILDNYVVIGKLGHFTLVKNEQQITDYFFNKNNKYFHKVYGNNINYGFDEKEHSYFNTLKKRFPVYDLDNYISDIRPQYIDLKCYGFTNKKSRLTFTGKQFYHYKHGSLILINKQKSKPITVNSFLYAHFQKRPMKINKNINYDDYYIVPNKYVTYKKTYDDRDIKTFRKINRFRIVEFIRHEYYWFVFYARALKNKLLSTNEK